LVVRTGGANPCRDRQRFADSAIRTARTALPLKYETQCLAAGVCSSVEEKMLEVSGRHTGVFRMATKARGFVVQGPRDESEDDTGEAGFGSERPESCCASSASTLKGVGSHECDDRSKARRTCAGVASPHASCGEPAVTSGNAGCPGG